MDWVAEVHHGRHGLDRLDRGAGYGLVTRRGEAAAAGHAGRALAIERKLEVQDEGRKVGPPKLAITAGFHLSEQVGGAR